MSVRHASRVLEQLFTYHEKLTNERCDALVDIQHAYGLLLHHQKGLIHVLDETEVKTEFERVCYNIALA